MNHSRIISMPKGQQSRPKTIDFTDVDVYPSKYRYVEGRVSIKSLMIENITGQHDVLVGKKTTLLVGDVIKIDIKFGHLVDGKWIDLYYRGNLRVKKIKPFPASNEILLLVTEERQT